MKTIYERQRQEIAKIASGRAKALAEGGPGSGPQKGGRVPGAAKPYDPAAKSAQAGRIVNALRVRSEKMVATAAANPAKRSFFGGKEKRAAAVLADRLARNKIRSDKVHAVWGKHAARANKYQVVSGFGKGRY